MITRSDADERRRHRPDGRRPRSRRRVVPSCDQCLVLAVLAALSAGLTASPSPAQDAAPVGALLADYDGLPSSHPGRMIIETAVGNYALGLLDAGGDCPRYRAERPATAGRLFLAWIAAARSLPASDAASIGWRSSVAGWIPVHCGA